MSLSIEEVALEAGTTPPDIQRFIDAGVIRPDAAGSLTWGDVQRARAVKQFLDAGVRWDHMRRAIDEGLITFEYADVFYLQPSPPSGRTFAEYRASLGSSAEHLRRIFDTLGLAEPPSNKPMRTDEEACFAQLIDLWTRVGGQEALLRATRLLGDHVRATVEGWMALWTEHMRYVGVDTESVGERQQVTLELGRGLTDLLPRIMVWAEQRYLEQAMTAVGVEQMEETLAERGIAPRSERQPPAVLFVDLAGFSRLTETHGDEAAVLFGTLLRDVAERAAREHGGKLIKLLGDGAMLSFETSQAAIDAGCQLLSDAGWHPRLPPPHIGVHAGPVIERDGDLFGGTVNIAARLSGVAGAGELVASADAVGGLAEDGEIALRPLGELQLKNISRPLTAYRVSPPDG